MSNRESRNMHSSITGLSGFIRPPSKTETQPMYKSPQKACLSSSPYLAPVWKVKNLVSQANCHRCGSDSCVGRTSARGILNVVRPMAGWFIGANEMIYSQWQKHAFCHHLGWSRWTKITVIIPQSERQKGKKKKKRKKDKTQQLQVKRVKK